MFFRRASERKLDSRSTMSSRFRYCVYILPTSRNDVWIRTDSNIDGLTFLGRWVAQLMTVKVSPSLLFRHSFKRWCCLPGADRLKINALQCLPTVLGKRMSCTWDRRTSLYKTLWPQLLIFFCLTVQWFLWAPQVRMLCAGEGNRKRSEISKHYLSTHAVSKSGVIVLFNVKMNVKIVANHKLLVVRRWASDANDAIEIINYGNDYFVQFWVSKMSGNGFATSASIHVTSFIEE